MFWGRDFSAEFLGSPAKFSEKTGGGCVYNSGKNVDNLCKVVEEKNFKGLLIIEWF